MAKIRRFAWKGIPAGFERNISNGFEGPRVSAMLSVMRWKSRRISNMQRCM